MDARQVLKTAWVDAVRALGARALTRAALVDLPRSDLVRLVGAGGASIDELNCVRRRVSRIKGGRLGRMIAARGGPATVVMASDVLGDDPSVIGGGPFVRDPTTAAEAREVLRRFGVRVPAAVE